MNPFEEVEALGVVAIGPGLRLVAAAAPQQLWIAEDAAREIDPVRMALRRGDDDVLERDQHRVDIEAAPSAGAEKARLERDRGELVARERAALPKPLDADEPLA